MLAFLQLRPQFRNSASRHNLWQLALIWLAVIGLVMTSAHDPIALAKRHGDRDHGHRHEYTLVAARDTAHQQRRDGLHAEIIGGTVVPQGIYPFATLIQIDVDGFAISCTGSLIAPRFVLTAAHCVGDQDQTPFSPAQFTLVIGRSHAFDPPAANVFAVAAVFRHPDWDPVTFTNDVAVLELTVAVPASIAQPIPLVASNDASADSPGQRAIAAGWGVTAGGSGLSPELRQIRTAIISDAACDVFDNDVADASVVCTRIARKSTCQGDSGGPLFVDRPDGMSASGRKPRVAPDHAHIARKKHDKNQHGHHGNGGRPKPPPPLANPLLIGVTSFGPLGCPRGGANGFAQLSAPLIRDFITSVINK